MAIVHSLYSEPGCAVIDNDKCIHCGKCIDICPAEILSEINGTITVENTKGMGCIACGHCMMVCPTDAIAVSGHGVSKDDLQAMPTVDQLATADQLKALMQKRRSCRKFSDEAVTNEQLRQVIDMASTAPMGIPPWDIGITAVNGKEKVSKITDDIMQGYTGMIKIMRPFVVKLMRPMLGKYKYELFSSFIIPLAKLYVEGHSHGKDMLFYDAPALLIFHHSPYCQDVDATIAGTYAMLAAESLGLGTTIIGGAPPIMQRNKKMCQELGIPKGNTPSMAMIIGHPATAGFRKTIKREFSHTQIM